MDPIASEEHEMDEIGFRKMINSSNGFITFIHLHANATSFSVEHALYEAFTAALRHRVHGLVSSNASIVLIQIAIIMMSVASGKIPLLIFAARFHLICTASNVKTGPWAISLTSTHTAKFIKCLLPNVTTYNKYTQL